MERGPAKSFQLPNIGTVGVDAPMPTEGTLLLRLFPALRVRLFIKLMLGLDGGGVHLPDEVEDVHYFLLWGTTELQEAEWFDEFDMPDGAEVTLVVLDAWFDHPNHPLYEESKAVHEARAKRRKRNEE